MNTPWIIFLHTSVQPSKSDLDAYESELRVKMLPVTVQGERVVAYRFCLIVFSGRRWDLQVLKIKVFFYGNNTTSKRD